MKKLLALIMFLIPLCVAAQNDWENPEVFSVGTEPARSSYARDGISLNGEWLFKYVHEVSERPVGFYQSGFDFSGCKNTYK